MERSELLGLSRDELIAHAERLGVPRPRVLTQPELMDEIISRTAKSERERAKSRGWLGRARDLLARVVEKGLHLPEAAKVLRSTPASRAWPSPPPPLATVTLAEIYAAQGHLGRAITVLNEVLSREPEHQEARVLRDRFVEQAERSRGLTPASTEADVSAPPITEAAKAGPEAFVEAPEAPEAGPEAAIVASEVSLEAPEASIVASEVSMTAPEASVEASEASTTGAEAAAEASTTATEDQAPPLPERYDVDEVVAIAVDPQTLYVYWEVKPVTFARAEAKSPSGHLSIRVVAVTPSWDGPVTKTWDLPVDALYGDRFIRDIPPGANVRVSVGWLQSTAFDPFAVGLEVASPRALPSEPVAEEVGRWSSEAGSAASGRIAAGGGGPAYLLASAGGERMPWARGRLSARPIGGASFGGGGASGGGESAGPEGSTGGGGGGGLSWVDPEAQRAAAPYFTRGGASELSRTT